MDGGPAGLGLLAQFVRQENQFHVPARLQTLTDAQPGGQDVVALEDDKHLQVNYFCSTVVREDTLDSHPGLSDALMLMDNILSDTEMAKLNARVETDGLDEADAAKEYLVEKGILEG